jgi:uncharacterized protein (DUF1015 family)
MEVEVHLVRPFAGLRPARAYAAEVAAPPYDVLSAEEARAQASRKPWSFLHISRPEIDLPTDVDPHSPQVYARGAENFRRMIEAGVLARDAGPRFYAYRMIMGPHSQTGLVVAASVEAYDAGRIRRHELTRPEKEDDRVRQIEALNAQTGPVLLAYPAAPELDAQLHACAQGEPETDLVADLGVRHTLWAVEDRESIEQITRAFDALPALYVADGHHRSAAASRVAAARRAANPSHSAEDSYNAFLAVAFPHHRMRILPYNRAVADLNGQTRDQFIVRVAERFSVLSSNTPVSPSRPGEFGLYLPGSWYRITIKPNRLPADDPIARLDVSLLSSQILEPLLGISDVRRDGRIDFVGGVRGLEELEKRVNSGEMACAFSLPPTSMNDLITVADAGRIMPPKSTWFEPKLADGLVSHVLD